MPLYEYECQDEDCKHRWETLQKNSEEPNPPCPECGGEAKRLMPRNTGLIFKGDGFYATDYKGK